MRYILDAGHGGMAWGHYLSIGKRSPEVPPGIFEGEFNRSICHDLAEQLNDRGIPALELCPGPVNIPLARNKRQTKGTLTTRVDAVNELCRHFDDIALLSIHANASGDSWDSRAWGSRHTKNRGIAKRGFTIIQRVNCPAVLLEIDFMTHPDRAKKLADPEFRSLIVHEIVLSLATIARRLV